MMTRYAKPRALNLFRQNNHKAHCEHFHFSYVNWMQLSCFFLSSGSVFPLLYPDI